MKAMPLHHPYVSSRQKRNARCIFSPPLPQPIHSLAAFIRREQTHPATNTHTSCQSPLASQRHIWLQYQWHKKEKKKKDRKKETTRSTGFGRLFILGLKRHSHENSIDKKKNKTAKTKQNNNNKKKTRSSQQQQTISAGLAATEDRSMVPQT